MKFNNAQEVFDHIINHLVTQGKRSYSDNDKMCLYRSASGMSCAVGCLMSDEEYDPAMEGEEVGNVIRRFKQVSWMAKYRSLLDDLQDLHDEVGSWDYQGLTYTALNDIDEIASSYRLNNPLQSENT